MARNNNRNTSGSTGTPRTPSGGTSSPARSPSSSTRPTTSSPSRASTVPRAPDPVRVAASRPEAARWVDTPYGRVLPGESAYGGGPTGDGSPNRKSARPTTPTTPTTPSKPATPRNTRVSSFKLASPRVRDPSVIQKSTSKASSAKSPRDQTKVENRMTCKARPDNNKPKRGGGGGGSMKRFIPWCG